MFFFFFFFGGFFFPSLLSATKFMWIYFGPPHMTMCNLKNCKIDPNFPYGMMDITMPQDATIHSDYGGKQRPLEISMHLLGYQGCALGYQGCARFNPWSHSTIVQMNKTHTKSI